MSVRVLHSLLCVLGEHDHADPGHPVSLPVQDDLRETPQDHPLLQRYQRK
jgi:hypothetical protein